MAHIGLAEAARITGKNRSTIFRAMKTGRLSFSIDDAGERRIDMAELERVFPATVQRTGESNDAPNAVLHAQLDAERRQNALLEREMADLRRRLDASEEERRTVQAQLTALLGAPAKTEVASPVRRGWWRFRRR